MGFQKNQIYTVTIEDIGAEGEGIGKIEGFSLFVKDALPGDRAKVRLTKVKKNYAFARLEEVLEPSRDRITPPCPVSRQCGGCQIQALSYEKQLAFKQSGAENNLVRIGGFEPEKIRRIMEPIIGMENPWHYRNKAQYPFGCSKEGVPVTGFYAGRTHVIIPNTDCLLGAPENKKILEIVLKHMEKYDVAAYDEGTGQGLVRHVLIRKGFFTGELMVCIVANVREGGAGAEGEGEDTGHVSALNGQRAKHLIKGISSPEKMKWHGRSGKWIPEQDKLVDKLALLPGMTSISVNFNTEKTNVILGKETRTIWGKEKIRDRLHLLQADGDGFMKTDRSVMYEISPRSFYQVNPVQAERLYSMVLSYAELTGKETVWDLYCGIGTISLFLSFGAKQVYGVEIIPEAIEDARENAEKNGITNVKFFEGKAEEVLPDFYGGAGEGEIDMRHPDVIVVDPPRKGCDEVTLETIMRMQPDRVVYVSCDSATLARDLKILCEGGYELKRGRVCDQFCHSVHVECVCQLLKKSAEENKIEGKKEAVCNAEDGAAV